MIRYMSFAQVSAGRCGRCHQRSGRRRVSSRAEASAEPHHTEQLRDGSRLTASVEGDRWLTGSFRPARGNTTSTPASLPHQSDGGAPPATGTGSQSAIASGCRRRGHITRGSSTSRRSCPRRMSTPPSRASRRTPGGGPTSGSTTASRRPCSDPNCSTTRRSGRSGRFMVSRARTCQCPQTSRRHYPN
jgi:hypothetical protein